MPRFGKGSTKQDQTLGTMTMTIMVQSRENTRCGIAGAVFSADCWCLRGNDVNLDRRVTLAVAVAAAATAALAAGSWSRSSGSGSGRSSTHK